LNGISFRDKIVVVTGGASGIGQATAFAFAAHGARVAVLDVDESLGAADVNGSSEIDFFQADVSNPREMQAVADGVLRRYGRPADILVSNAGIEDNRSGNLLTMPDAVLRKIVEVNLYGGINSARAFAPAMPDGGKIVFVSSLQAFMVSLPGTSYQASKAGLIGVAKALAVELGPRRINVNVICPGGVATEGMGAVRAGDNGLDDFRRNTPLGRRARSEEIAYPILFLCSEWASYMTGQIVQVDGGKSAMGMPRAGPIAISPDDPDKQA
jgi:NAD(P)-dependent dehydrogenase (short-subunit alcohol dehydrogenase family)